MLLAATAEGKDLETWVPTSRGGTGALVYHVERSDCWHLQACSDAHEKGQLPSNMHMIKYPTSRACGWACLWARREGYGLWVQERSLVRTVSFPAPCMTHGREPM